MSGGRGEEWCRMEQFVQVEEFSSRVTSIIFITKVCE